MQNHLKLKHVKKIFNFKKIKTLEYEHLKDEYKKCQNNE